MGLTSNSQSSLLNELAGDVDYISSDGSNWLHRQD
jgi:hypothetical protein